LRVIKLAAVWAVGLGAVYACERQTTTPSENNQPALAQSQGTGDPAVLALIDAANQKLKARGLHVAVEAIQFFTIGEGRPSNRIHAQEFRWVPNDPRRIAQGDDIIHLIATNRATTASGLTAAQTTAEAIGQPAAAKRPSTRWAVFPLPADHRLNQVTADFESPASEPLPPQPRAARE
jgi:hypothetical protein